MPYVRPDVANMLALLNAQPGPQMHEMTVDEARAMIRGLTQMADRPRGALASVTEVAGTGPAGPVPCRIYRATAASEPAPVLVYFHGGGWVIGDLESHDPLCAEIARGSGMTVVAVDYRLAPEHPFPAAVDDCLAATRWLASSPSGIGHAVTGIVVAGDSAGGNLSAVVAQQLGGQLPVPILAQWLIYPGVDMTQTDGSMEEFIEGYLLTAAGMTWFTDHYMGGADPADPRASPLLAEDLTDLPAALVFTCGLDPLRDQGRAYAARLIEHGVSVRFREAPGQIHGCLQLRAGIPSAQGDLAMCLADLRALVAEAQASATAAQATTGADAVAA